jgi:hypothetical protein
LTNNNTATEQAVGGVSPTTPTVEAINPLPTIVLWSMLAETANALSIHDLSMDAAVRVCNRFLLKQPIRPTLSLTNGLNLFLDEENTLSALAVQQSTLPIVCHFIQCFILFESQHFRRELFGKELNWNERNNQQIRYLTSLRRCGIVVSLSSALNLHNHTARILSIAFQLLQELLQFDQVALAQFLQNPVGFVLCLIFSFLIKFFDRLSCC